MKRVDLLEAIWEASICLGFPLADREKALISQYIEELLEWNEKVNLVSRRAPEEVVLKNFITSFFILRCLIPGKGPILDLGSGGGFPGIPIKLLQPALQITLVEASRKKVSFLKHALKLLNLEGIEVIHARAETIANEKQFRAMFDAVIAQAAFNLLEFLKIGERFLSFQGKLITVKGAKKEEENPEVKALILRLNLETAAIHEINRPPLPSLRVLIFRRRGEND